MDVSIWTGNLAAYTCGELVGDWVDLDGLVDVDDLRTAVAKVTHNAEEIYIADVQSDYDLGIGEYASLDDVWEKVRIIGDAHDPEAMSSYLSYHGWDLSMADEFAEAYCGEWESLEEYAISYYEEVYGTDALFRPGFRVEVDIVAWECDFFTVDHGRVVHVFRSI